MVPARIWSSRRGNIDRARSRHKRFRRLRRARNYLRRGSLAAAGSRGGALHGGMSCFIYWSWAQESASRSSRFSMQICEWNWALHGGRASSAISSARYSCWPLPQCPTSPGCRQPRSRVRRGFPGRGVFRCDLHRDRNFHGAPPRRGDSARSDCRGPDDRLTGFRSFLACLVFPSMRQIRSGSRAQPFSFSA
jgi:hypothetical protein